MKTRMLLPLAALAAVIALAALLSLAVPATAGACYRMTGHPLEFFA